MKERLLLCFVIITLFGISGCGHKHNIEIRNDWKAFYDQYQVTGSFALYDSEKDKLILYNKEQFQQLFSPASTFKICNSLIGLETGVIRDEHFVIPWDRISRNPVWDKDHDMKTAFKNSTVWYYQEVARRVGPEKMKFWLDRAEYGNADTSGGIDQFWLNGGLRISPMQQIEFLRKLHNNQLPFSKRSMEIVKRVMITDKSNDYSISGKTGWGSHGNMDLGWYVGYIELNQNTYYFSNCVQLETHKLNDLSTAIRFDSSRTGIVNSIFKNIKLLQSKY